jgi:putative oxidoreductase
LTAEEGVPLQRLFSTFPNGWPGSGLLLLRVTGGLLLLHSCIIIWHGDVEYVAGIASVISSIIAILLVVGLWTPVAGVLFAAAEIPLLIQGVDDPRILICLMVLGVSISMLGPGAFSIDALIFGRHRLDLPDR